ncbi:DUF3800 domain-containing protein [Fretibacter rubidus]|uniref:DUF3800 domain-containing protein n=1 Tax=Fretibacter rubidus TaxID=570162 RepID=UPI003529E6B7
MRKCVKFRLATGLWTRGAFAWTHERGLPLIGVSCGFAIRFNFSSKSRSDSLHSRSLAAALNLSNWDLFFIVTYIAFIDESGDHGMNNIDPASPWFALTAAVYLREDYLSQEIPAMSRIKLDFWSHDGIIFHDYDIKKKVGPFSILIDNDERQRFFDALSEQFRVTPATIISAVINKDAHSRQYRDPMNPYELCVQFVLERIHMMTGRGTCIVFESRGKSEDNLVREWSNKTIARRRCDFDIHFAKKSGNVEGLQMADLACQPIIHYVKKPDTDRPDWLAVKTAIRTNRHGAMAGYGLKTFP